MSDRVYHRLTIALALLLATGFGIILTNSSSGQKDKEVSRKGRGVVMGGEGFQGMRVLALDSR
jgi:hypothetical protein